MAKEATAKSEFISDSFKKLPVSEKFLKVFNRFRTNLIFIFVVILLIDITALFNLSNIYNVYYEQNSQQGEIRITIQALAKYYLWAISAQEENDRNADRSKGTYTYIQQGTSR